MSFGAIPRQNRGRDHTPFVVGFERELFKKSSIICLTKPMALEIGGKLG